MDRKWLWDSNRRISQNSRKLTNMAFPGLRIRPNRSPSNFLSIGDPPRPEIPPHKSKNQQKNRKSENREIGRMSQIFSRQQYYNNFVTLIMPETINDATVMNYSTGNSPGLWPNGVLDPKQFLSLSTYG